MKPKLTLDQYQGQYDWAVLTWEQLEALYEEYANPDGLLGELLIAIQIGDMERAQRACAELIAGELP